jgi:hypothetical protein
MKQSPVMSFVESVLSTLAGFGISLAAQWFILPLLGVSITLSQNLIFAVIMTAVSIARGFVLRRLFEALHIRRPLSPFMQAVIAERFRQVEVEGYDVAHDDELEPGRLARAGAAYALSASSHFFTEHARKSSGIWQIAASVWPFRDPIKLYDFRRDLVRAGALIIADGERHDRNRKRAK